MNSYINSILKSFLLVFLMIVPITGQCKEIVWSGDAESMDIGNQVFVLEDPEGQLTIDQVSSPAFDGKFSLSDKKILNFGISESFFWIKFAFVNHTNEALLLEMAQAFLPTADLYFKGADGAWNVQHSGYSITISDKLVKSHFQVFRLVPGEHTFYVRFQSFSPPTTVSIWQSGAFEVHSNVQNIKYGLYAGILLFVIINNILLYFSFRRFSCLHYALVVLIYLATTAAVAEGYLPYLVPSPDMIFWYHLIPEINMPFTWSHIVLFLDVKRYLPRFYRVSIGIFAYLVLIVPLSWLLPITAVLLLNQINAMSMFILIVIVGVYVQKKGNIMGYYIAATYLLFCFFVVLEAIYIQTGSPPFLFGISHISVALMIEVFLLSYLLSKRFEWEKKCIEKERTEAQHQLLEQTRENERIVREQNINLEQKVTERTVELNQSITNLKALQSQLIQSEKMASLGELTAGIAHETQNPLNFVNNFSEVSSELLEELIDERRKGDDRDEQTEELLLNDLSDNLQKITHHGKRADSIVKGMLEHSRAGSGQKEWVNINALATEYLRLSYLGIRARDKSFNAEHQLHADPDVGNIEVVAQDIGRVLLNLMNNAFYAVHDRKKSEPDLKPLVTVTTRRIDENWVEIRVRDNGVGIEESIRQKIFQPFFSTKPTGEGTGLGLSLSYEIVINGHGGKFTVESEVGKGAEFIVTLPTRPGTPGNGAQKINL
jgi:two-component system NtrC family sensor kinase